MLTGLNPDLTNPVAGSEQPPRRITGRPGPGHALVRRPDRRRPRRLGGAFFTIGSTGAFSKDLTVGNGFIALAALIMGRWHPIWATVMALFFGFVIQMASQLQTLATPVPSQFLLILPYVATIIAVARLVGRVRAPAADGVPYTK